MFSDSDLTDIESSEDEVPLASTVPRKTKTKPAPVEYNVKNTLSMPRTASYTAKSLYGTRPFVIAHNQWLIVSPDQIVDNTIDLDPEYQRGALHSWQVTWDCR